MKILSNENLFAPIINYLKEAGHDVLSVREAGLSGISDEEVYRIACNEGRVIITMDRDFTRTLRFPPAKCEGIIVAKIYRRTVQDTLKIFKKHFEKLTEDDIRKNLVIISPEGPRIRAS